jgi:hypothetical protein
VVQPVLCLRLEAANFAVLIHVITERSPEVEMLFHDYATSAVKACIDSRAFTAALKALRHPKPAFPATR